MRRALLMLWLAAASAAALAQPLRVARIEQALDTSNPVRGWVVRVDLSDPVIEAAVLPAGEVLKPAGSTTTHILLATPSAAAQRLGLDVAMNASFFGVDAKKRVGSRDISYFVGNPAYPVGWQVSSGTTHATPRSDRLRATLVISKGRTARIEPDLRELPADALHAVSGNALLLRGGAVVAPDNPALAPRSAAGVSADGKTLILLAIDGRQPGHSVGTSYAQTAQILLAHGASDAINLDGGGSTALVIRDPATGVHVVANKPSDPLNASAGRANLGLTTERPVVDVIGIRLKASD